MSDSVTECHRCHWIYVRLLLAGLFCPSLSLTPSSPSPTSSMALLTPPSSTHRGDRDKENRFSAPGPSTRTVVWSSQNTFHYLTTPPKDVPSSKERPGAQKSILKKCRRNTLLSVPEDSRQREVTPEPSDPLVNLHYLDHPVAQILSTKADGGLLAELIEGYNVLAARLRATVTDATDADASWPLFQPLRKNAQAFVDAVVRDLGRALVDPVSFTLNAEEGEVKGLPQFSLPSPKSSPTKKKAGMTEEQVKFARDLCTTTHSVLKLLSVILSTPAIYTIFEGESPSLPACHIIDSFFRQTASIDLDCRFGHSVG
ncbi:hypothetical protein B0H34DRAFT_463410 [Crassisporium funariophilum]|nr:hypothetical protein B0H34DRAFT_463410 [Crassisporium funariophilum]